MSDNISDRQNVCEFKMLLTNSRPAGHAVKSCSEHGILNYYYYWELEETVLLVRSYSNSAYRLLNRT